MVVGKIIGIVGNAGAGKTTLVQALQKLGRFNLGLESHTDRPFQARLANGERRFALANQWDYLLLRAEQELHLRSCHGVGLVDGGLDQDYWVFTRYFHQQGWLDDDEFGLCQRFYTQTRRLLPAPELTVVLHTPLDVAGYRLEQRRRVVEVAKTPDLAQLQSLLDEWTAQLAPHTVIHLDAAAASPAILAESVWERIAMLEDPA